jgi:hypothetical protein
MGAPGPDGGYALLLAGRFRDRLAVASHEHRDDAVAGCVAVALKRASRFGRAPVVYDLEHAFTLWGFLTEAPPGLVRYRGPFFEGARHEYWERRVIVDKVPDETLRLTPTEVRDRLNDWRTLILTEGT